MATNDRTPLVENFLHPPSFNKKLLNFDHSLNNVNENFDSISQNSEYKSINTIQSMKKEEDFDHLFYSEKNCNEERNSNNEYCDIDNNNYIDEFIDAENNYPNKSSYINLLNEKNFEFFENQYNKITDEEAFKIFANTYNKEDPSPRQNIFLSDKKNHFSVYRNKENIQKNTNEHYQSQKIEFFNQIYENENSRSFDV